MCGVGAIVSLTGAPVPDLAARLDLMNTLQRHRGPDGVGAWAHPSGRVGLAHRRLSIIDIEGGAQPMGDAAGRWISFNGEIYNHPELRSELGGAGFRGRSDTEVLLKSLERWGPDALAKLRGMFGFALWDEPRGALFCARDRFGIKPLYYTVVDGAAYVASECKALLPFVKEIRTDVDALKDYLAFQFCLAGKTLFAGIQELLPGHTLTVHRGRLEVRRYWEVYYNPQFEETEERFAEGVRERLRESVGLHLRSDVPVGAFLSGGLDSSLMATLAVEAGAPAMRAFTGKFDMGPAYDESPHARAVAEAKGMTLDETVIREADFVDHLPTVIYHLDAPVAGPGSLPQFLTAKSAARHRKVVLGGQGGDEIFGGYARYLIAYFEQCIKAAIDGTMNSGNFIVTYESIIPNLSALRSYKPLLQDFWREGLFEDLGPRYFRLINRSRDVGREVRWDVLGDYNPYETFRTIFEGDNVRKESYFDRMTHFDFKTLLPALLQVEDRVTMAHGLESRVPFLDHRLVEYAATMPSNVKFKNGAMKHLLRTAFADTLPRSVLDRKDKMGFPVPFTEWAARPGRTRDFVRDTLGSSAARGRPWMNADEVLKGLDAEPRYGRKLWGLLSLELWQKQFHDRAADIARAADFKR